MSNRINSLSNTISTFENNNLTKVVASKTNETANDDKALNQVSQKINPFPTETQTEKSKEGSQDFWINKNIDPKKMGDELLKTHFNFNEEDLKAYKEQYDEYTIKDNAKCELATKNGKDCVVATSEDVKGWRTENGKVPITLDSKTVKFFQDFRQQRVIDKAVNNISDPNLRNQVRSDLMQIATGEETNRVEAANRLMYLDKGSESDLNLARQAVKTVAAQPENRNNAITNLVASKVNLDEAIKREDLRGVSEAEWQMNKAVKLVQGQDTITGEYKKDAKVNREEAAWVNRQAAQTLRSIGQNEKANERETLARYYEVDDQERKSVYPLGEIDRWKKNETQNSVRPVSQAEMDWQELQEQQNEGLRKKKDLRENRFKFEYKVPKFLGENSVVEVGQTNKKGKITLTNVPLEREKLAGSVRVYGTLSYKEYIFVNERGIEVKKSRPFVYKNVVNVSRTTQSVELNRSGINNALGVSSGAAIIGELNRFGPVVADYFTHNSVKKRVAEEQMEKANKMATKLSVPPKPEDLPKERERLLRLVGNDQKGRILVNEVMRDLEVKSHAFWNR